MAGSNLGKNNLKINREKIKDTKFCEPWAMHVSDVRNKQQVIQQPRVSVSTVTPGVIKKK